MMKKLTRQHFFNHGKPGHDAEKKACHWCQLRSFKTHKKMPISIVNEIDDEPLPANFRFINRIVYGEGVKPADDSFRSGCSCDEAGHDCQFSGCSCLEDIAREGDGYEDSDVLRYAYHTSGRNAGLLRSELLNSSDPLYECHDSCACYPQSCPNRVVQRGRTVPLQIIRTVNRGWGVRSTEPIRKGQFVDSYIGEVITPTEADRRREASDLARRKDIYLFALDKFARHAPETRPLEVDGEFMAGPTRFINHSCDPNLRIFARVGDHADTHLHDLAFFAIKNIEKGEELTFDYTDGEEEHDGEEFDPHNMTACLCGSANCRGYLW